MDGSKDVRDRGRMEGRMDRWKEGRMDRRIEGKVDGWMDGRGRGRKDVGVDRFAVAVSFDHQHTRAHSSFIHLNNFTFL